MNANHRSTPMCTIAGCSTRTYALGLCSAHYTRQRRHGSPFGGRTPPGTPFEWLVQHIDHTGADCLIWPFARAKGYGMITFEGGQRVASNLMCELAHGLAPTSNMDAAHSCGNGHLGCVNPLHLRWATRAENHQDMFLHGVRPLGERTGVNKLTADQVREIRRLRASGLRAGEIADQFGISRANVYKVANRENWEWLD